MKRKYGGYHFNKECKNAARGFIETKHSYIDYSDFKNDNSRDKVDDEEELNEIIKK